MKAIFLILSGAMFLVGLVYGPIKVNISGLPTPTTLLPDTPSGTGATETSEWFPRNQPTKAESPPHEPTATEPGSSGSSRSSPSVSEIGKEVERVNRILLEPLIDQITKLTGQTQHLEKQLVKLESANSRNEAQTERAILGIREELASFKKDLGDMKAKAETSAKSKPEVPAIIGKDAEIERLKTVVEKLKKTIDDLAKRIPDPAKATPLKVELPKPRQERQFVSRDVKLDCGYFANGITIPTEGAWVGCPKCGGQTFVK